MKSIKNKIKNHIDQNSLSCIMILYSLKRKSVMSGLNKIKTGNFDVFAHHTCGASYYHVSGGHGESILLAAIPQNVLTMNDDELREVHIRIMHAMNVLWSSTGGVPCFPEQFGHETRMARGTMGILFAGRGWNVSIYRDYDEYKAVVGSMADRVRECYDDQEKVNKLIEEMVSFTGNYKPVK